MKQDAAVDHVMGLAWGAGQNDCWIWDGNLNANGQPVMSVDSRTEIAARFVYLTWLAMGRTLHGELEPGNPLVQTCGNRLCCSPWHQAPAGSKPARLDPRGYNRTKLRCPQGHWYEGANLKRRSCGRRRCRTCHNESSRRSRARRRERERLEAKTSQRHELSLQPPDPWEQLPHVETIDFAPPVEVVTQIDEA